MNFQVGDFIRLCDNGSIEEIVSLDCDYCVTITIANGSEDRFVSGFLDLIYERVSPLGVLAATGE